MEPIAPPTPQEVQRKLSFHAAGPRTPGAKSPSHATATATGAVSGTESDSDGPNTFSAQSYMAITEVPMQNPPLAVISERRAASGEESDEEEEEGEFRPHPKGTVEAKYDELVVKSGYLWKKGERRKTWKKRWFVLRTAKLAYYKNDQEYQLLRLLDLRDIHSAITVSLKHHANTFGIVTPTRTFYIQAPSEADRDAWVRTLNEVRSRLKDETGTPVETIASTSPRLPAPITATPARKGASPTFLSTSLTPPSPALQVPASPSSPTAQGFGVTSSDSDDPFGPPPARGQGIANDPKKIVLSGYLMKCGSKRKNWRKRWFVLTSEKLVYAKSHMDTKPHRQIPLDRILDAIEHPLGSKHHHTPHIGSPHVSGPHPQQTSSSSASEGSASEPSHVFKIITPKKPFLLCAPSEEEEIKWLSAVRALIARRTIPGEPSSTSPLLPAAAEASTTKGRQRSRSRPQPPILAVVSGDKVTQDAAQTRPSAS